MWAGPRAGGFGGREKTAAAAKMAAAAAAKPPTGKPPTGKPPLARGRSAAARFPRQVLCEPSGTMGVGWERDHLWLYLLALGFGRRAGGRDLAAEKSKFDNHSNSSMIRDIILFLFTKLDQSRAAKAFRDCAFRGGSFTDRDFRKQCCLWLKDIANQHQSGLPQITPSAFISPTGPKFTHLLYRLARHVVVEDMKRSFIGTGIHFAEAVKLRPKDMYMADARYRVAYNKLLQIFQKEDFVIQEYEKKAQLLIKEIKQIKSEYAVLQIQSIKMKQNDQNKNDKTERIQKVRSMWTLIMEMLTSLKKEREVVDSVLEDRVGPWVLDGANVVFSVPQLLARRVESDIHQLCTGNLYEGEKLNFLTVMQLLNEALRALRDERCQSELKLHLQVKGLENKVTLQNKLLRNLKEKRLQIEQEHRVSTRGSISRTQEEWEVKWKSFLGLCPFSLILNQDTEFGLSRASPPHSFNLAEEDEDGVFFQKLLSVSDVSDSINEVIYEKNDAALETVMDKSTPLRRWISSVPLELSKASENRDVLIEKNLPVETCSGEKKPVPPKILKNAKDESAISEMWENAADCVIQTELRVKKEDPLKRARDELAEEVAKTVMSESPQSGEEKGMALEDLISSLALNPFLTRKQIPRTPENLLTEIRSSWRKAIQTEGSSETELTPTKVMTEEARTDATAIIQKAADSGFVCSTHASPVPDFDPPLSERKSQLSSTEFRPPKRMKISHIIESPILETSGMQECERTEERELTPIVLKESSVEDLASQYVEEGMNTSDTCSENNSRAIILPSDQFQHFLMDGKLHCSASPLLSSISCEAAFLQIFDEKLLEELDSTDPEISVRSESDFDVMDSKYVIDGSENKEDVEKSELDLQFSTCEVLKKTAPRSKEELPQTRDGGEPVSCRSDPGLAPEEIESNEFFSTPKHFCLDEEFTKTPSPMSVSERKCSLSSLLESYQHLEEMVSMVHKIPLDLIHKLEDKEQLNEKLDTKEPSS